MGFTYEEAYEMLHFKMTYEAKGDYRNPQGRKIHLCDVIEMEMRGWSDRVIAAYYGITGTMFGRIRKYKMWDRQYPFTRRDKGIPRVDPEKRRLRLNVYMREYRRKNPDKYGYDRVRVGKYTIAKSREVACFILNRVLKPEEIVHHEDKNVKNNDPGNLMVFANQGDHLAWHRGEDVRPVEAEVV